MECCGSFEVWNGNNTEDFAKYVKFRFHSIASPDAERYDKKLRGYSAGKHAFFKF